MIDAVYQRIRKKEDQLNSIPAGVDFADASAMDKLQEDGVTYETLRYLKFLEKAKENKWFCSWNWAALVFGEFWLIYRRAYQKAFFVFLFRMLFLLASLGVAMLFGGGFEGAYAFATMLSVGTWIIIARWGDALYMQSMLKKIDKNKDVHPKASAVVVVNVVLFLISFIVVFVGSIALRSMENHKVENVDGGRYESE